MKSPIQNWDIAPLSRVCKEIVDCINKTAPSVDFETPYKMIRTTNVKEGRINLEEVRHVDESTFVKWTRRSKLRKNDVILTREAPLGEVGLLRVDDTVFLGQRTMVYRANAKILSQRFMYYSFLSYPLQSQIQSLGSGSTVEHLRVPHAENLKIPYPILSIQRKIAAVLSAYDDLIENSNHRIVILEKMAEELYREWFVRLRFPGHERVKIIKGVPEGWEVKRMSEVIEYYIGGGWGEDNEDLNHPVGAFVIRGTDIPNLKAGKFNEPPFRFHKSSNYESRALTVADIVFEVSGGSKDQLLGRSLLITDGILKLCNGTLICASFCKLIRPNISPFFLNYFLQAYYESGLVDTFQIQSTGISNYQFESFTKYQTVLLPPKPVLQQFDSHVEELIKKKDALSAQNRLLNNSRDRLLSRLMSGKIDVEHLDIQFPESMKEEAAVNA